MPYVNFKEENYKLEKQISKRKENNKNKYYYTFFNTGNCCNNCNGSIYSKN